MSIDQGEEIGDGVGGGGGAEVDESEGPDVEVEGGEEVFFEVEGFEGCVGAVDLDLLDDEGVFAGGEEGWFCCG